LTTKLGGRGAFTLLEVLFVVTLIALIVALAIPNAVEARKRADEASAVKSLKDIFTHQAIFREGDREKDHNLDYGMLSELQTATLVDEVLGTGTKQGYLFEASYSFTSSEYLWFGTANPILPFITADRYFAVNNTGVVYYTSGRSVTLDTSSCLAQPTWNPQGDK
jgi:type II secretory pathway pseudopilin PulG